MLLKTGYLNSAHCRSADNFYRFKLAKLCKLVESTYKATYFRALLSLGFDLLSRMTVVVK